MSNRELQIYKLAEQGLTAAEIAEALRYNVEDVETIMLTNPEIKKGLEEHGIKVEATEQLREAMHAMAPLAYKKLRELLIGAEKESVQYAAIELVVKHEAGLLRPKEVSHGPDTININLRFEQARQRMKELEEKITTDITSELVKTA